MISIQNLDIPTKGVGKYLAIRVLSFDLKPNTSVKISWSVHNEVDGVDSEGVSTKVPGKILTRGILDLPIATYNSWGTDDDLIIDWVLEELNIIKL